MLAHARTLTLAAAALLVTGACDAELREQSLNQSAPPANQNLVVPDAGTSSLLQSMMNAPATTELQGIRRFEAHWNVGGQMQHLVYREQLSCDGQGRFAVDPTETIDPQLGGGQESVFFLVQKHREGFMFWHRDFMVRDLDLFFSRYQVVDLGVTTYVAGKECAQLDVQLQQGAQSVFHLAIDLETSMLLRAREESLVGGALISLLEFESLEDVPDFSATVFHLPLNKQTQLDKMKTPLLFVAAKPKLLPAGYQLLTSTVLEGVNGTETWVRYIYSDGLQELFFLCAGQQELLNAGSPPPPTVKKNAVTVVQVGPWNVVQGTVFDGEVIVMGVAPVTQLLDMIESAFN